MTETAAIIAPYVIGVLLCLIALYLVRQLGRQHRLRRSAERRLDEALRRLHDRHDND